MMVTIIDGTKMLLGRLASNVAKRALLGEEVAIVNSEKVVISGSKKYIMERRLELLHVGQPNYGPFYPRAPDRFVKRVIKGMLPCKRARGREALKRVKCYIGFPEDFKKEKLQNLENADSKRLQYRKVVTIGAISKRMGVKL